MPRKRREEEAGAWNHVMGRAVKEEPLFLGDADRAQFLFELGATIDQTGWRVPAFCLMRTHYHLLVQTPHPNLAHGMHRLGWRYAEKFNRRHRARGHVFGRRYEAVRVRREAHLIELFRYLARNPVRAKVVARPEDWRGGGHGARLEAPVQATWLAVGVVEELFGSREAYRAFVEEDVATARAA